MLPASRCVRRCSPTRCTRSSSCALEPCPLCIFQRIGVALLGARVSRRGAAPPARWRPLRLCAGHRARGARDRRGGRTPPVRAEPAAGDAALLRRAARGAAEVHAAVAGDPQGAHRQRRVRRGQLALPRAGDARVGADLGARARRRRASSPTSGEQVPQHVDVHAVQRVDVGDAHALVHLVDRGVDHAELDHLRAERRDEAAVGGAPAGRELRRRRRSTSATASATARDSRPGGV